MARVPLLFLLLVLLGGSVALGTRRSLTNPVVQKLRDGTPVFGSFAVVPSAKVVECMAVPGFVEFLWIEGEHTAFGADVVEDITAACENEGIVAMTRIPKNDLAYVKKYLGTGVRGVVIPQLQSYEEAREAVRSLRFPPRGNRPVGVFRANGYDEADRTYRDAWNDLAVVSLMVESEGLLNDIEQVAGLYGVDVLHPGKFDLAISMGVDVDSQAIQDAMERIERAARNAGVPLGAYASSVEEAYGMLERGYRFFVIPGDMELLRNGVKNYFPPAAAATRVQPLLSSTERLGHAIHSAVVFRNGGQQYQPTKRDPTPFKNPVKDKLKQDTVAWGAFNVIPKRHVIENLAATDQLDWIWIEAEHSEFYAQDVQALTLACENVRNLLIMPACPPAICSYDRPVHKANLVPVVRVPENNLNSMKKFVGTGVMGVVIPQINTADDARKAVQSLKYSGNRPAGVERANRYLGRFNEYLNVADDLVMVVLMVETKEFIENVDEILDVEGIDVLHMGPYDLSLSLNVSMDSEVLANAIAKVEHAASSHTPPIPLGATAGTWTRAQELIPKGYRFLLIPSDAELIMNGVSNYFKDAGSTTVPPMNERTYTDDSGKESGIGPTTTWIVAVCVFLGGATLASAIMLYRNRRKRMSGRGATMPVPLNALDASESFLSQPSE